MKEKIRRLLSFKTILRIPNPALPFVRLNTCVHDIRRRVERLQVALGRIESRLDAHEQDSNLHDHEFQVFSQWGEDGLIQYLLRRVAVPNRTFVEFVEGYQEANTRFLVKKDGWSALVVDCAEAHVESVRRAPLYWRSNVKVMCAFVDGDNMDGLIPGQGIEGDIGLLSIDIDGNDYWVWHQTQDAMGDMLVVDLDQDRKVRPRDALAT